MAALILGVGRAMLRSIGKKSLKQQRHGKYVLGWMLAGWLIGSAIGLCILDKIHNYPMQAETGLAGFGLLLGWLIGMIHGAIMLVFFPIREM